MIRTLSTLTNPACKFSALPGSEGWLYIWDIDDIEAKLFGRSKLSATELRLISENFSARDAWASDRGFTYIHLIAPDKATIYPEFLPAGLTLPTVNLFSQYRDVLHGSLARFVDTLPIIYDFKSSGQAYFKTDSHWTYPCAQTVLAQILSKIIDAQVPIPPVGSIKTQSRSVKRILELGALTTPPTSELFEVITPEKQNSEQIYVSATARGKAQVFRNADCSLPRCMLFRDSFSSFFLSTLVEYFSEVVVLNTRHFWHGLIEAFEPDVVIVEVAERFLYPPALDAQMRSFEDVFKITPESLLCSTTPRRQR